MDKIQWWAISVPVRLLTERTISPAARHLYMVLLGLRVQYTTAINLTDREFLKIGQIGSRDTFRKYLKQLESTGWLTITKGRGRSPTLYGLRPAATTGPLLSLPGSLIEHPSLTPTAKWLYCFLRVHCRQRDSTYTVSQAELLHEAGYVDDRALRASIRQLVQTGWLRIRKKGPGGSVYQPLDPHLALREAERDRIESYLKPLWPKGEALLKEMLNVFVDDPHYEDNARPGYLVNPLTGKHLEVDREYSRAKVLIEFNGPRHYRVTKRFSNPKKIAEQRQRDLTKAALAAEHGYAMVIILAPNLTFPALQSDLAGLLPLRKLHFEDPVVKFLDTYSRRHANRAGRGEFTEE